MNTKEIISDYISANITRDEAIYQLSIEEMGENIALFIIDKYDDKSLDPAILGLDSEGNYI